MTSIVRELHFTLFHWWFLQTRSSEGMKTEAEIFAAVAANPGLSVGIPLEGIQKIWAAVGDYLYQMLVSRRSVVIPNFAHFVAQQYTTTHHGRPTTAWRAAVQVMPQ